MNLNDFDFDLPKKLIAQIALEPRDSSKLFFYDKKNDEKKHLIFSDLVDLLDENSVLVFNKSRVIPARIKFNWKEIFLSKLSKEKEIKESQNIWEAMIYPGKSFKKWRVFELNWAVIKVLKVKDDWLRVLEFTGIDWWKFDFNSWLSTAWEAPVPPYIEEKTDFERYQTTFSKSNDWKSVAAPTAGLHFTEDLFSKLKNKWIQLEFVHLDVWLWTFLPPYYDDIKLHKMHSESFYINKKTAERLNSAKEKWKKIIAVWTTSIRVLETVADLNNWKLKEYHGNTEIFIYPWYKWKFIDEMITNFHLPKSTLLMLVSAFIWTENLFDIYEEAIEKEYRFYSFWDAMYLKR